MPSLWANIFYGRDAAASQHPSQYAPVYNTTTTIFVTNVKIPWIFLWRSETQLYHYDL